jgi:hypothetical protein
MKKCLSCILFVILTTSGLMCQEKIFEKCLDRTCILIERISILDSGVVIFQRLSDSGKHGRSEGSWRLINDTTLTLKRDLVETTYSMYHFLNSEFLVSNSQLERWSKVKLMVDEYSNKDQDYLMVKTSGGDSDRKEKMLREMIGIHLAKICGKELCDIYFKK